MAVSNESARTNPRLVAANLFSRPESYHARGSRDHYQHALTTIAFWFYEIFLPGPPHPYIGILVFLTLPAIFVIGLLLIPLGIWLKWRSLIGSEGLPAVFPAVDLRLPAVRRTLEWVALATGINLLIIGTASYRGKDLRASIDKQIFAVVATVK